MWYVFFVDIHLKEWIIQKYGTSFTLFMKHILSGSKFLDKDL